MLSSAVPRFLQFFFVLEPNYVIGCRVVRELPVYISLKENFSFRFNPTSKYILHTSMYNIFPKDRILLTQELAFLKDKTKHV